MALQERFEFHAHLTDLDPGLELIHRSLDELREASGRPADDRTLMLFEIALAEIGGNVLTHGRPVGTDHPVDYALSCDGATVEAIFSDRGAAAHEHLSREMPGHDSERGRGLAIARSILDELGYERQGDLNRWRLVKRL